MKGISTSELAKKLEALSKRYNCKLWIARRLGRRWSYVTGFGSESLAPARLILESGDLAVFGEVDDAVVEEIANSLKRELKQKVSSNK
ncbi:MAG: hypothetical protein J7J80_00350 [Thermotogae bacterium]|nr:hypothetical protein [Thermotogota bacterium]